MAIDYNEKLETLDGLDHVEAMGSLKLVGDPALKSLSRLVRLAHLDAREGRRAQLLGLYLSDVPALQESDCMH